jgi:lipoprotein-anchoring transpeptidase ErfK/SrfK
MTAAIALAIAASGCGSDSSGDESRPTVSIPTVTTPELSTTAPSDTQSSPATTTTGKGNYNPTLPDSETNDVPPAPGSPEDAFEKQCAQNPQACG